MEGFLPGSEDQCSIFSSLKYSVRLITDLMCLHRKYELKWTVILCYLVVVINLRPIPASWQTSGNIQEISVKNHRSPVVGQVPGLMLLLISCCWTDGLNGCRWFTLFICQRKLYRHRWESKGCALKDSLLMASVCISFEELWANGSQFLFFFRFKSLLCRESEERLHFLFSSTRRPPDITVGCHQRTGAELNWELDSKSRPLPASTHLSGGCLRLP